MVLAMKVGNIGEPTTLCSVRPSPANWVCFWRTSRPRWAESRPEQDERDDQDVDDEEARDDDAGPGELAAPQEGDQVAADEGDGLGDGVADAQAGARDQVVGQRVADEALEDGQDQHRDADESSSARGACGTHR